MEPTDSTLQDKINQLEETLDGLRSNYEAENERLREAVKALLDGWIQPKPRSMYQLKIDMDAAYQKGEQALQGKYRREG